MLPNDFGKIIVVVRGIRGLYCVRLFSTRAKCSGRIRFKIYGNANYNPNAWQDRPGGSAEPGIVLVSKDENGNGLPDDEWYELAGSEYGTDTEIRDYEITYYRPEPENADVRWIDNQGNEGYVYRNTFISSHRIIRFGKRVIA